VIFYNGLRSRRARNGRARWKPTRTAACRSSSCRSVSGDPNPQVLLCRSRVVNTCWKPRRKAGACVLTKIRKFKQTSTNPWRDSNQLRSTSPRFARKKATSLSQRKKTEESDKAAKVPKSLVALANLRTISSACRSGELGPPSLQIYKRHLALISDSGGRGHTSLGRILDTLGKYDEAIPTLKNLCRLDRPKGVLPDRISATLSEPSQTHHYYLLLTLGHYDISKNLNERASSKWRSISTAIAIQMLPRISQISQIFIISGVIRGGRASLQ